MTFVSQIINYLLFKYKYLCILETKTAKYKLFVVFEILSSVDNTVHCTWYSEILQTRQNSNSCICFHWINHDHWTWYRNFKLCRYLYFVTLLYTEVNIKLYCTHFLYCPAQLSWLDINALFRPVCQNGVISLMHTY